MAAGNGRRILNGNGYTISYTTFGRMDEEEAFERGLLSLLQDGVVANLRVKGVIDDSYRDLSQKTLYIGAKTDRARCITFPQWNESTRSAAVTARCRPRKSRTWKAQPTYGIGGLVGRMEAGEVVVLGRENWPPSAALRARPPGSAMCIGVQTAAGSSRWNRWPMA